MGIFFDGDRDERHFHLHVQQPDSPWCNSERFHTGLRGFCPIPDYCSNRLGFWQLNGSSCSGCTNGEFSLRLSRFSTNRVAERDTRTVSNKLCSMTIWLAMIAPITGLPQNVDSRATGTADEIHWTFTGPTSASFHWRGTATEVRYGSSTTYGVIAHAHAPSPMPFSSPGPFWEAELTGLQPGSVYHYSIGSVPDKTFHMPPKPGVAEFSIDVEGDIGGSNSFACVPGVQRLIADDLPAFVLMLGDLTYGNETGQASVDQHFNDVMVWSQNVAYMPAWATTSGILWRRMISGTIRVVSSCPTNKCPLVHPARVVAARTGIGSTMVMSVSLRTRSLTPQGHSPIGTTRLQI